MKKVLFFLLILIGSHSFSQTDSAAVIEDDINLEDFLEEEDSSQTLELLPEKMMLTQRIFWGQRGLLRSTGLVPLNQENRSIELQWRRNLLVTHQVVGYATLASMIGTGITGTILYNTGRDDIKGLHEKFAGFTTIGYTIGGTIALFGPPGLKGGSSKKWDSIDWHKFFAYGHVVGMVTTNILGHLAEDNPGLRNAHRISGYSTAFFFTASFVSIKF